MAFPVRESTTGTTFSSASTTHNVSMPATVNSGDCLLILFSWVVPGGFAGITTPSGWTLIDKAAESNQGQYAIFVKVADGTEGGTTVNVATGSSGKGAAQCLRISGWYGATSGIGSAVSSRGFTSEPNPPSLSPSWGSADTLWVAAIADWGGGGASGLTVSSYPTNYSGGTYTTPGGSGGGCVGSATRQRAAATENPGIYTMSGSEDFWELTVAIRPSAGDTTAPTLTSATGTATGTTTADLSVSTNEANGTLYTVVTESATAPSAAQVKAGQDHTGSAAVFDDSQAISSTGSKSFSATGLTASTTYYAHYMHEDAATNQSSLVTSSSFTTDADSVSPKLTLLGVG